MPQRLALDGVEEQQEDGVPWLCSLAFRGRKNRRTLGNCDVARSRRRLMVAVTVRSNAETVAEYLDCVVRKDLTAVDRFFHPDIEYVINGSPLADRDPAIPPISAEC